MSNHIYIITTPTYKQQNMYKVGKHKGNKEKLIKRYITALPNVEVLLFEFSELADIVETNIKVKLEKDRLNNVNGFLSEWVKMPLNKLKSVVNKEILIYQNKLSFNKNFPNLNIHPIFSLLDFIE